jgi:transposase
MQEKNVETKTPQIIDLKDARERVTLPHLTNYTLSTVCPNCNDPTYRRACKVRCDRCGFMWDCSEL